MAEGKWIYGLGPATPVAEAARRTLAVRLQVVRDYLSLAVSVPDKDIEYVHQLRVGTRRAGAALDIFALCLPEKAYQGARRRLRRLRRAAGAARDWDVFLAGLRSRNRRKARGPGADFLLGYALGQRAAAQNQLTAAAPEDPVRFDRFVAETVAGVRDARLNHGARTLLDLARPMLLGFLKELNEGAAADLRDYGRLHQVRIIGKRLRYAMEIFADCFAEPFRGRLYPLVEEMQEVLGRANDSHVATVRLTALREKLGAVYPKEGKCFQEEINGVLRYHQRRLPRERRRFLQWWKQWQTGGARDELVALLGSPAPATS
jgi:CHAD domain-containing protein